MTARAPRTPGENQILRRILTWRPWRPGGFSLRCVGPPTPRRSRRPGCRLQNRSPYALGGSACVDNLDEVDSRGCQGGRVGDRGALPVPPRSRRVPEPPVGPPYEDPRRKRGSRGRVHPPPRRPCPPGASPCPLAVDPQGSAVRTNGARLDPSGRRRRGYFEERARRLGRIGRVRQRARAAEQQQTTKRGA
jgi:hypothetical protein